MLNAALGPKLKELRLSGILDTLDRRAGQAQQDALTPVEFLALLLDDEIERRRQSRLLKQERDAGLDPSKRLSLFDFTAGPGLDRRRILDLFSCEFIARKDNGLLSGPTGTGESHLSSAIGGEALAHGYRVSAVSANRRLGDLFAARADGSYPKRLHPMISVDLLIVDDFGLRPVSSTGAEDLSKIIPRRYEKGSLVLTRNRAPQGGLNSSATPSWLPQPWTDSPIPLLSRPSPARAIASGNDDSNSLRTRPSPPALLG